ncbi:SPASM domain-containing protein [Vibrio splendidus]|nr:SPASM domain-containing protein [Vibrio splendidus]MCC4880513.1 SPASM domain-containing protein [Vibrio splendidus]
MENTEQTIAQYCYYPTMNCSLDCGHCFIEKEIRDTKDQMTVEQFKLITDKYVEHYRRTGMSNVEITIMGGEPTLMPNGFYEEVIPHIRESFAKEGNSENVFITLMSNFMHMGKLKQIGHLFNFVNTSFEPQRFSEERKRIAWEENVVDWITKGNRTVLTFTTTNDVLERGTELFDYFYAQGVRHFQVVSAVPTGGYLKNRMSKDDYEEYLGDRIDTSTTFARYRKVLTLDDDRHHGFEAESEYFIKVAKWLLEKKKTDIKVRIDPIHSMLDNTIQGTEINELACGTGKGFSTRTDGLVVGCTAEMGNSNPVTFGNIFEQSMEEIENSDSRQQVLFANERINSICIKCEFNAQCKGGCHQRARLWDFKAGRECHGMKTFLTFMRDNQEEFTPLREYWYGA